MVLMWPGVPVTAWGEHPAVGGEDPGRDVPAFAHDGAEGGADEDLGLLLDHRLEAGPHHLVVDGGSSVRRGAAAPVDLMLLGRSRWPPIRLSK